MKNIQDKLKAIRKKKGISQKEVATCAGISIAAYSNIESGISKSITIEVGKGISKALNVPFGELFEVEAAGNNVVELEKKVKELDEKVAALGKQISDKDLLIDMLKKENLDYKRNEFADIIVDAINNLDDLEIKVETETDESDKEKYSYLLKEEIDNLKIILNQCIEEKIFSKERIIALFMVAKDSIKKFRNKEGGRTSFFKNFTIYLNQFFDIREFETEVFVNNLLKENSKLHGEINTILKEYNNNPDNFN